MSSVQSIVLHEYEKTIKVSQWDTVYGSVRPYTATNKCVWYQSSKPNVVYVDSETGCIHGLQTGRAVITVYSDENHDIQSYCVVNVEHPVPVSNMWLTRSKMTLKVDEYSDDLCAEIFPYNATNKNVTFVSSNPNVARVYFDGGIRALSPGTTIITATTDDGGYTATCKVHVIVGDVTIKKIGGFTEVVFESGKRWQCINKDMIYKPENATRMLIDRSNFNLFVNPNTVPIVHEFRYYSPEEFKVLFAIDPLGVARYIEQYAIFKCESLCETLQLKDEFFELFFDRKPKYFTLTNDGDWIETTDKSDPENVISESESYFGIHSIGNIDGIRILTNLVDIGTYVLSLFSKSDITDEIIELGGTLIKIALYCYDKDYESAARELLEYAINVDYETDPDEFDIYGELLDPVFDTLAVLNSMQDILDCLSEKQMYYCATIDYCVNKVNYNVKLQLQNGNVYTLSSINDLII